MRKEDYIIQIAYAYALKLVRKNCKITREQLAKEIGYDYKYLSKIESGTIYITPEIIKNVLTNTLYDLDAFFTIASNYIIANYDDFDFKNNQSNKLEIPPCTYSIKEIYKKNKLHPIEYYQLTELEKIWGFENIDVLCNLYVWIRIEGFDFVFMKVVKKLLLNKIEKEYIQMNLSMYEIYLLIYQNFDLNDLKVMRELGLSNFEYWIIKTIRQRLDDISHYQVYTAINFVFGMFQVDDKKQKWIMPNK